MSIRILTGDCRDVLRMLPAASVQCCVTSPPYFGLRQYLPEGHPDMAKQIGLEQSPAEYVAQMVAVFREVRRVLRDDGVLWLNLGDCYTTGSGGDKGVGTVKPGSGFIEKCAKRAPVAGMKTKDLLGIPWRVAFALQDDGWYLRSDIIWHKANAMPESVTDRPTKAHEYVFMLTKSARYFWDADAVREPLSAVSMSQMDYAQKNGERVDRLAKVCPDRNDGAGRLAAKGRGARGAAMNPAGANLRTVWTIATQPFSGSHFATMPPELAERCIKAGTSEQGCCPKCGAQWERVIEKESRPNWHGNGRQQKHDGTHYRPNIGGGVSNDRRVSRQLGWAQTCSCHAHAPVPCVVLDPFGGAGTTGLVADRLGRDAILIELNPDYAAMASGRVSADAGLFAKVSAA